MKEKFRRPVLFLVTVTAGSLLILFDIPPIVIIAGTVLAGFLMLLGTGALPVADLHPSRLAASVRVAMRRRKAHAPKPTKASAKASRRIPDIRGALQQVVAILAAFIASLKKTVVKSRAPEHEKRAELGKIDEMLDKAIHDPIEEPESVVAPTAGRGRVDDPLSALDELDTSSLDDLDLDGEVSRIASKFSTGQVSALSAEDESAVSDILKAHQDELDDLDLPPDFDLGSEPSEGFPSAPAAPKERARLASMPAPEAALPVDMLGGLESDAVGDILGGELGDLDEIDLDEIEIEDESGSGAGGLAAFIPEPEEPDEEEVEEEEEPEDFDMVSFASGGLADDDLLAELKSDVKKRKAVEDVSLLRDLKGMKFSGKELADEMEDLLRAMRPKH
ncbi:hypothetical protein ABH15_10920 [Methanoculleus taiwanensis]|uniref:Uncharacterized protein n=1 Tax=Methanoculleus taiwanensis TaxID=1550565 RepID=A0A498GYV4_9EURY|nr:hypothetical protein [Methanoculleus taiwanensis]RXE55285.1 hypothetical protein ABH15_10920 [Methanoculleus taiwanensis]